MRNTINSFFSGLISALIAISAASPLVFPAYAEDIMCDALTISPGYLDLVPGGSYKLTAKLSAEVSAPTDIVWSSEDPGIAAVDEDGLVTAVSGGETIITASAYSGTVKADCIVDIENETVDYDYSEWNMATNVSNFADDGLGFDWDATTGGGNYMIATAYLARWDGAVAEEDDSYPKYVNDPTGRYQAGLFKNADPSRHVQDIAWLSPRKDSLDNNEIKNAISKYGAVYTLMNNEYEHFTYGYVNYYYDDYIDPENYFNIPGHAVAIVGWDDNYPKSAFKTTPPGDGAFICKNSWDSWFGDNGYFYVSYYDQRLCRFDYNAVVTGVSDNTKYNKIYQYDPFGPTGYMPYSDYIYISNVFPEQGKSLDSDEELRAVSLYTYNKKTPYEVYVVTDYKDADSFSEMSAPVATGEINSIGYHTIELEQPVTLAAGTRFAVIIKLIATEDDACIYIEEPYEGYAPNANANDDESYISYDAIYWDDFTWWIPSTNICIKAFTHTGQDDTATYQAIDNSGRTYDSHKIYTLDEIAKQGTVSRDFIRYMSNASSDRLMTASDTIDGNSGTVNPFINPPSSDGDSETDAMIFPSKFDLRALSLLTPIRDQGQWNTCWAHSICASLESYDLRLARSGGNTGTDPEKITLSRDSLSMVPDTSYTLAKSIFPLSAINEQVQWTSSNPEVATVEGDGTIRAVGMGSTTIKAVAVSGNASAECIVSVSSGLEIIGVDESSLMLSINGTLTGNVIAYTTISTPLDITAMLAIYNEDGTLAGISTVNTRLEENKTTIGFDDINIQEVRGVCKKKLMIWNSIDNMRPLADALYIR